MPQDNQKNRVFRENKRIFVAIMKKNRPYAVSLAIILSYLIYSVIMAVHPQILGYDPVAVSPANALQPPSLQYPFGTTDLGRNLFLAVLYAAPIDAGVSMAIILLCLLIGLLTGTIAGYASGKLDEVTMRTTDVFLAFPALVLCVAIAAALGPGLVNALLAIGAVWWPVYTRIARGETLSLKEQNFILAARASGLSRPRIIVSHIIPNVATTMIAYATGDIGNIIILFSVLGYLGLGAQPPMVDLGRLVYDGQNYIQIAPFYPLVPAAVIFVICVSFALVGDMVGELLNPKLRR